MKNGNLLILAIEKYEDVKTINISVLNKKVLDYCKSYDSVICPFNPFFDHMQGDVSMFGIEDINNFDLKTFNENVMHPIEDNFTVAVNTLDTRVVFKLLAMRVWDNIQIITFGNGMISNTVVLMEPFWDFKLGLFYRCTTNLDYSTEYGFHINNYEAMEEFKPAIGRLGAHMFESYKTYFSLVEKDVIAQEFYVETDGVKLTDLNLYQLDTTKETFYVGASDETSARIEIERYLNVNDYGYSKDRIVTNIHLLALNCDISKTIWSKDTMKRFVLLMGK